MDEGTLNDLLECSVCLERLDTSSKVLPCQHTFCRKCLEEIVKRHKELRCPECRVLVNSKVEELPPNVLLMRILEGMRNAAPKRSAGRNKGNHHSVPVSPAYHNMQGAVVERKGDGNKQQAVVMPHQPYAKALYDYTSNAVGELSFKTGDTIVLKKRIDNHWYQGECGGRQGAFPLCYVQVITPVPSHTPQCKALYDFRMTNDEEEGCLAFNKGDVISVIRRVDENWAEGKLNGKIGIFPLAFVELNSLARSLMKLSKNSQPGPSRIAPPTPTAEDSAPLIPTDHTRNVANILVTQPLFDSTVSSGGSSATTTPNTSSSTNSSGSSTAPSSPASPPPRNQPIPPRNAVQKEQTGTPQRAPPPRPEVQPENHHRHHHREKRHSFTLAMPHQSPSTHRHSAEIFGGTDGEGHSAHRSHESGRKNGGAGGDGSCPLAYIALYPYKPQKPDELELRKGGIYMVTERCQDGWFKGISNRTQKCGVFPGNYVTLARGGPQPSTTQGAATEKAASSSNSRSAKNLTPQKQASSCVPPELPPRSTSPNVTPSTISTSWHGQQETSTTPIGRSSSAVIDITNGQATSVATKPSDKSKERREKGGGTVSLMRRLTSMKRSKSPPPSSYSMDNPVFEDTSVSLPSNAVVHPVHIRSGSCPSQLLQLQPNEQHHRLFSSASQRLKHKERPTILTHSSRVDQQGTAAVPDVHHHRKSNSLDTGSRPTKTGSQTVRERFRCIAPYPPNSEYELELQVNDIIYVHKKRDDGWYKGTQQRTGRTGLFPASFVESF